MTDGKDLKTKCTLCGLCKPSCPAFNVLLDEATSPRGKAVLLKSNVLSKHLYLCTLCKACEEFCTIKDIDLVDKIRKAREKMVASGKETEAGRKLIENIRRYGTSVGKVDDLRKAFVFGC